MKRHQLILMGILLVIGISFAFWWGAIPFGPVVSRAPQDHPPQIHTLPEGPVKVVTLGTSLTANGSWPQEFATRLETILGHSVHLTVIAGPGETVVWGRAMLDRLQNLDPDLVVIEFAVNDSDLRRGVSVAESATAHAELSDALVLDAPGRRVIVMSTNPAFGLRGLLRIFRRQYVSALIEMAEDRPWVGYLDLRTRWWQRFARTAPRQSLPDGLHPTATAATQVIVPPLSTLSAAIFLPR